MKRRSENAQVRKEDYDETAAQDETPAGPFARAPVEELLTRKRVRISEETPIAIDSSAATMKKNPFASVAFASTPAPFQFSAVAAKPPTAAAAPAFQNLGKSKQSAAPATHAQDSNATLTELEFKQLLKSKIDEDPYVDVYPFILDYIQKATPKFPKRRGVVTANPSSGSSTLNVATTVQPSSTAAPKSTFTFGSNDASTNKATTGPSFSFPSLFSASTPAATTAASSSSSSSNPFSRPMFAFGNPAVAKGEDEDDVGGGGEEEDAQPTEEPTQILREENKEEDILMECNAKHGKMVDGQWKMYTAGQLRLYRNKINLTQQKLVIRNNMGKVLFNVGIQKGMKFMKQVSQKKGSVTFVACEDRERGMEKFAVSVKAQDIEQLFTTLESMAKE